MCARATFERTAGRQDLGRRRRLVPAANREALMRGQDPSVANRPRGAVASPVPSMSSRTGSRMRIAALALLATAQLFDYVSFMVMIERHGRGAELNPIVVAIADSAGLLGLTVVRGAAVG